MPQHAELTKNSKFQVYIGIHKLAFSKISSLSFGMEKEVYAEGGGISDPHVMRTPETQLKSVRLERGIQSSNTTINRMKPGTFIPWVQIIVMGEDGRPSYEYFLEKVWVVRWELSDLNALDGSVLIDTFELEYVNLKRESMRYR